MDFSVSVVQFKGAPYKDSSFCSGIFQMSEIPLLPLKGKEKSTSQFVILLLGIFPAGKLVCFKLLQFLPKSLIFPLNLQTTSLTCSHASLFCRYFALLLLSCVILLCSLGSFFSGLGCPFLEQGIVTFGTEHFRRTHSKGVFLPGSWLSRKIMNNLLT